MAVDVDAYYRTYGPMVLRRCRKLLRHDSRAEDAMHDVFVEVLRHEARLVDRAPSSLLYRIATNICLNLLRADRRRPESPDDELVRRIAAVGDGESHGFHRRLLGQWFRGEPESTRTLAVLHLVDGMTLEEVADEVGLSVSGVRKRLRRLRRSVHELEGI